MASDSRSRSGRKAARPGRRRFRLGMRGIMLSGAAFAAAVATLCFWLAWDEHRTITSLRDRGALTTGRFVRNVETQSRDSRGFTQFSSHTVWAYTVGGRRYQVQDNFRPSAPAPDTTPRLGPAAPAQIVYLPDDPGVARMRAELSLDLVPWLGTGGMFLLIALVFGGSALFLLKPRRGLDG